MKNLIALDIGDSVGVAILRDNQWQFDTWVLDHEDWAARMLRFWGNLAEVTNTLSWLTDYLVIEKSYPRQHKNAHLYIALTLLTHMVAKMTEIPRDEVSATTARKAILGRGDFPRDKVLDEMRKRGFAVEDKHQADALIVGLAYVKSKNDGCANVA